MYIYRGQRYQTKNALKRIFFFQMQPFQLCIVFTFITLKNQIEMIQTRKIMLTALVAVFTTFGLSAQQYKVVTSVESIVPSGLGRSRIINAQEEKDYKEYTSVQTEEDNTRNKSKRKDIRVKDFEETKLLNFYNIAGIRFQNIAANDALLTSMMNDMAEEGWELAFVTSSVESDAGDGDGKGIFITRYVFKKNP